MIQKLLIQNYAIIKELEITFSDKLTIITGETGAGKSILLGALGLIMGQRADRKVLYNQKNKCVIEAYFNIQAYNLKAFFEAHDIDYEAETIVRRELTPSGKSRAFVNDTPVNLATLKQLSGALIDLHQQFDTLDMHDVSFQLRMVDALANNQIQLDAYQAKYKAYKKDKKRLEALVQQRLKAEQEADFIAYQLEEFDKTELVRGEQDILEQELKTLTNAEEIKKVLASLGAHLSESEQAVLNQLSDLSLTLSNVKNYHAKLPNLYERLEGIIAELQDVSGELIQIEESTEYDSARIEEVQTRLDSIYKLQQKHHVQTIEELIGIQSQLQSRLDTIGDLSDDIERLEQSIDTKESTLHHLAKQLSNKRKAKMPAFEKQIDKLLSLLSMPYAQLKVDFKTTEDLLSTGTDDIRFLFAPNKGSRFEIIKDVASGGELSRLTLCVKSLVADAIPLPSLIFDEIDTGISGDVALKMGTILRDLSNRHQVISITHSPQIAAKADKHYFVYKKVIGDKTITNVRALQLEERVKELATMLSGNPPTPAAIDNARELLAVNVVK